MSAQGMVTRCMPANRQGIIAAVGVLKEGGLVAFPTETVYGLGANALMEKAVKAIFSAKGRPGDNPLIAHVPSLEAAEACGVLTPLARQLARAFWPGPLTLVVGRKPNIAQVVSAGLETVALRVPDHPVALALLQACGFPVAAPSANRSGRPSPTTASHVLEDLGGRIPLVLDGGPCEVGLESTVVDATGTVPRVLRPGAVTPEMLATVAGECLVAPSVMRPLAEGEDAPSPGMRHQHYAPQAPLTLVEGEHQKVLACLKRLVSETPGAWVLAMENSLPALQGLETRSLGWDAAQAAHRLFYLLRKADEEGASHLFVEALPATGLGLAVMNRLARAAGFDIRRAD